jgi:PAS domain S-box-containing protein
MTRRDAGLVLLVEDDPDTAGLEQLALTRAGFRTRVAQSIDQAKLQLAAGGFDAVLLDYHLPDGSAWEVADAAAAQQPRVPVVLVTAMGSEHIAAEAIQHGISEYIRKTDTFWNDLGEAVNRAAGLARTQAQLRHNDALFRLIADNANDIIILLDAEEAILYASAAVTRILGYLPEELFGETLRDLVHADDLADWPLTQSSARASAPRRVFRCRGKQGEYVPLEPTFRPIANAQIVKTIGVLRDVTAQLALEEQIRHQQRLEAVGQLTAGIAHDFNNLLQAMMGSLELLLDELGDQPELRECAEGALRMGERGARLTHHLLAFARKQVLKPRILDLPDLLNDVTHALRRVIGPQIEILIEFGPGSPHIFADPGQLEAAVLNLALNARDAMPKGGTLRIATGEAGPLVLNAMENATPRRYAVLVVADTGSGMTAETLAKACEPFFTTKGPRGSGLGLSMVHGFARQSGGDLRVQSTPGAGTRIELWLPTAEDATLAADSAPPQPGFTAGHVVLVDDEPEVLAMLGSFMRGAGFSVRQARSGDEALAMLATSAPVDLLVTDYAMPGLDGAALVARARQMRPDLAVLVISGDAEAEHLDTQVRRLRVMRKPFRRSSLLREVAALIEGASHGEDRTAVVPAGTRVGFRAA